MLSSGFLSTLRCGLSSTGSLTRLSRPATFRNTFRIYRQLSTETIAQPNARLSLFAKGAGAASVAGLGISAYLMMKPSVFCERTSCISHPAACSHRVIAIVTKEPTRPPPPDELPPPPPGSAVSLYELSFGTVAGICAGVFIKKGAKAAAFLLGGIFVLLQVHHFSLQLSVC